MPANAKAKSKRARRETIIEDAVMAHPEILGFPNALSIRNCRVSLPTGRVDVVLLPHSGPIRLVLVETKVASAHDAASKVIGQLLMYYTGALEFGAKGIQALRKFAAEQPDRARSTAWISPKLLSGGISPPEAAFKALSLGRPLRPNQIQLFVAIDGDAHRALEPTLKTLRDHHGLKIGLVVVRGGKIASVSPQVAI